MACVNKPTSIINSLIFGSVGHYKILGFDVVFKEDDTTSKVKKCLHIFNVLNLTYVSILVHEMGHALACKALTGSNPEIEIYSNAAGFTIPKPNTVCRTLKDRAVIYASGPILHMFYCVCLLTIPLVSRSYILKVIRIIIREWASNNMLGEFLYACKSTISQDNGDFSQISKCGLSYFTIASTTLVGLFALGVRNYYS